MQIPDWELLIEFIPPKATERLDVDNIAIVQQEV